MAVPAIQKSGNLLFQKIVRLRKIDKALDGAIDDELSKKLISDFEIVKGSWKGEFDIPLERFLRAFESSGLCQAMLECTLASNDGSHLRSPFYQLFKKETGQPQENAELAFNQIYQSFKVSITYLSKDPILTQAVRYSIADLRNQIEVIKESNATLTTAIASAPTPQHLNDIIPKVIKSTISDTKYLRVETSQGRKEIDISKIYIPPRLRVSKPDRIQAFIKDTPQKAIGKGAKGISPHYTAEIERQAMITNLTRSTIDDLETGRRIVVLGNPGGGKSTLLQSMCNKIAVKSSKLIQDGRDPDQVKIPIRVILREFESARLNQPQLGIFEYIVNDILHHSYTNKDLISDFLHSALSRGMIYLAFDGLDEILKTASRRSFVDIVNRFVRQYPLCQVLVTSREVGYENAPLSEDEFDVLILGDFAEEDVHRYAQKFIQHLGKKSASESKIAAQHFIIQTTDNAADLRRNPLMLGLMMWIFNIREDVPSNRPEIYQECSRLMFERWDGDRGIIADIPKTFDTLQVFSFLASQIFDNEELSAGVSSQWLENTSFRHLSEILEDAPQARSASKSLVNFIVDRSWVMSEKGEDVFSFTHQTFLEYFFAKYNDDRYDTVHELYNFLMPKILQNEWDVVSRLSLQIKTYRNRRRQDEVITLLTRTLQGDLSSQQQKSVVSFAKRCLEFLVGSEHSVRVLVEECMRITKCRYQNGDIDALETISLFFTGAQERRKFISLAIETWLHDLFHSGDHKDRDFVVACIDGVSGKFSTSGESLTECGRLPHDMAKKMQSALLPIISNEIGRDFVSAKTFYEWTGTVTRESLESFGCSYLRRARPALDYEFNGLACLVLAASGRYPHFFERSGITKQKALSGLCTLANYFKNKELIDQDVFPFIQGEANPPLTVWLQLITSIRTPMPAKLGAFISCVLDLNNHGDGSEFDDARDDLLSSLRSFKRKLQAQSDSAGALIIEQLEGKVITSIGSHASPPPKFDPPQ
jgi:energy-coupling factor transporter ATP-binding protein EcfA2